MRTILLSVFLFQSDGAMAAETLTGRRAPEPQLKAAQFQREGSVSTKSSCNWEPSSSGADGTRYCTCPAGNDPNVSPGSKVLVPTFDEAVKRCPKQGRHFSIDGKTDEDRVIYEGNINAAIEKFQKLGNPYGCWVFINGQQHFVVPCPI